MNIEAEEILSLIKTTNLTGAWNALNFLARNWDENATIEDLAEACGIEVKGENKWKTLIQNASREI